MNYKALREFYLTALKPTEWEHESNEIIQRVAYALSGKTPLELITEPNVVFSIEEVQAILHRLKSGEPIQYILGFEWFGNLKLAVNPSVLIPRPETEELCLWLLEEIQSSSNNQQLSVLDIGTGSGCIPIYLKTKKPELQVTALDISTKALETAQQNAITYGVEIDWVEMDILHPSPLNKFNIIICNPPYILPEEQNQMQPRVKDYEPHQALFVTNHDVLQFYKAVYHFARRNSKPSSVLFFEVHQDYAHQVENYFQQKQMKTELRKDVYGNSRMLKCWFS
jgi:release factor glutamine methyltransferase